MLKIQRRGTVDLALNPAGSAKGKILGSRPAKARTDPVFQVGYTPHSRQRKVLVGTCEIVPAALGCRQEDQFYISSFLATILLLATAPTV